MQYDIIVAAGSSGAVVAARLSEDPNRSVLPLESGTRLPHDFGSRQLHYEWFYAGDPMFTRARFYYSPAVNTYKAMVDRLLN